MFKKLEKLSIKELLTYFTCILSLVLGWSLAIAGFIVPPMGEIHDSVLYILAQALIYSGSCIGITQYYSAKLQQFESKINTKISGIDTKK